MYFPFWFYVYSCSDRQNFAGHSGSALPLTSWRRCPLLLVARAQEQVHVRPAAPSLSHAKQAGALQLTQASADGPLPHAQVFGEPRLTRPTRARQA